MEVDLISKKLEGIEEELNSLKALVNPKTDKSLVSLKGILKGLKVTEDDIQKAKSSLFHSP